MQNNPLRRIEEAIQQKLLSTVELQSIIVPGGVDDTTEQFPEAIFKAGWEQISQFALVSSAPRSIEARGCTFNVTLDSKNLNLHTRAMDFILWAMFLLEGLQPWTEVEPLLPTFCGYRGHDFESGYSRYQLTLNTSFKWLSGDTFSPTQYTAVNELVTIVDIKLWNAISNATVNEVIYANSV